jgi:hypothetical protein
MNSKAMGMLAAGLLAVFGFGSQARAETNIVLLGNGLGAPNTYPPEQLPASFAAWCVNCFPTVKLALADAKTKVPQGFLYAWDQNVVAAPAGPITADSTFCFDEFVIWQLPSGEIHTVSTRGPCGTYLDKTLVPPVDNPAATVVAAVGRSASSKRMPQWQAPLDSHLNRRPGVYRAGRG